MSSLNEIEKILSIEDWDGYRDEALANLPEDVRELVDSTSWAGEMLRAERLRLAKRDIQRLMAKERMDENNMAFLRLMQHGLLNEFDGPSLVNYHDRREAELTAQLTPNQGDKPQ